MIFLAIHRVVFVEHVFFARVWNFVMPKITWCSVTFVSHEYSEDKEMVDEKRALIVACWSLEDMDKAELEEYL